MVAPFGDKRDPDPPPPSCGCVLLAAVYIAIAAMSYGHLKESLVRDKERVGRGTAWTQADRAGCLILSAMWPLSLPISCAVDHTRDEASW